MSSATCSSSNQEAIKSETRKEDGKDIAHGSTHLVMRTHFLLLPSADRLNGTAVNFMSPLFHLPYGSFSGALVVVVGTRAVAKALKFNKM